MPMFSLYYIPKEKYTIDNYIENISSSEISQMINSLQEKRVQLFLPKFRIEQDNDLKEILKSLNLGICLSDNANFSKISDEIKLKIEKIIQKGYLEVNEEGTEFVLVTFVELDMILAPAPQKVEPPIIMDCNRPFLFLISPDIQNIPKDYFLVASVVNEFKNCQPVIINRERVIIYGDKKVGKTFLIQTLCENFLDNDIFTFKDLEIDGKKYKFDIIEYKNQTYYRDSNIQIYVFNICDLESFNNLKNIFYKTHNSKAKIGFVGFKWNEKVNVNNEEINKFAEEYNAKSFLLIPKEDVECLKKILVSLHQENNQ